MTIITDTDSYKFSHYKQYPSNIVHVSSYIEARGVDAKFPKTDELVYFGLQAWIKKVLSKPITLTDIDRAEKIAAAHGEPFNRAGWEIILNEYNGFLPISIESIDEGLVVPIGTPLVQVMNCDDRLPWLTSYIETSLLRAIWYPSTVATLSYTIKKMMAEYWKQSVDEANLPGLNFALHDFGARGASSEESAMLGGMGHLLSFNGTDTISAILGTMEYYNQVDMPAFSVPAAEHSTITSWSLERELEAYSNMIDQFGGEGKIYSVVADSYDVYNAVENLIAGELLPKIKSRGGRFVIRPDSGDPLTVILKLLEILEKKLGSEITVNSKGYKVLPNYFRILQGDGVNYYSIEDILSVVTSRGWSAENLVFGMGGALLQKVNRDSLKFAMKANAVMERGSIDWLPVSKNPVTDSGKKSKAGRIKGGLKKIVTWGQVISEDNFANIRERTRIYD